MTDEKAKIIYLLCLILKQLGFRKRTDMYIIKPKSKPPLFFRINPNNFWRLQHYDYNGLAFYVPTKSERGDGVFQPCSETGCVYALPTMNQIVSFCTRRGYWLRNCDDLETTIADLIIAYRGKTHWHGAFSKHLDKYQNQKNKHTFTRI